jgi:F-type H+-transporting ATPase subunit epsilon
MNMPENLSLTILTPEKVFFKGEVTQIIVSTPEGEMGIIAEHMPIIAVMPEGILRIERDGQWRNAAVSQGFLDMSVAEIEIFVDSAEWAEEIDVSRSEAALHRAEERLHGKLSHAEYVRTHAAISRATARLRTAKGAHE